MISQDDAAAYLLPKKANKKLRIVDTVVVHDKASFRLQKDFAHREIVKKGEIIAHEKGEPVVAKQDCLIIMPSPIENMYEGEEYCFLAEAS